MVSERTLKAREVVRQFPHTSKKQLGVLLAKKYPVLFEDPEQARLYVRTVTGAGGKTSAKEREDYKGLPEGRKNDYEPVILPAGKYGVLSDVHIPNHDKRAVDIAINEFIKRGIKRLLLNGDILDCYQVSDHLRDPTEPQLKAEFELLRPWLIHLQKLGFKITYKLGNHEERLERYLIQKATSLFGWEILSWENLIQVTDIQVIDNKRIIKLGSLAVVHGHEFGRQQVFNPVNPARGYFMRAKSSVLGGDKHQTSEHIESDINGKIIGAWSTGALCDLHPKYLPINRWNLGFAIVEHDGDEFEVNNLKIINGKLK